MLKAKILREADQQAAAQKGTQQQAAPQKEAPQQAAPAKPATAPAQKTPELAIQDIQNIIAQTIKALQDLNNALAQQIKQAPAQPAAK